LTAAGLGIIELTFIMRAIRAIALYRTQADVVRSAQTLPPQRFADLWILRCIRKLDKKVNWHDLATDRIYDLFHPLLATIALSACGFFVICATMGFEKVVESGLIRFVLLNVPATAVILFFSFLVTPVTVCNIIQGSLQEDKVADPLPIRR
jgi:hypothetical protein